MVFRCRMCGTCCMYLGDYLAIEGQPGPFTFACEAVSTGTPFTAVIDPDKRELFLDESWISRHPHACRFLRPRGEQVLCTIHETSPAQCRYYRCVVMRVYDRDGALLGKVTGTLALHSEDRALGEVWAKALGAVPEGCADTEERLRKALETSGFRVV
jgi:Fe-S-cluster containining protein